CRLCPEGLHAGQAMARNPVPPRGRDRGSRRLLPVVLDPPAPGSLPQPARQQAHRRGVAGNSGDAKPRPVSLPGGVSQQPSGPDWSGPNEAQALQALEAVIVKYHGDRRRLYLTGLSMGGAATWKVASDHPEMFAAIIPTCGRGSPARMAPRLKS